LGWNAPDGVVDGVCVAPSPRDAPAQTPASGVATTAAATSSGGFGVEGEQNKNAAWKNLGVARKAGGNAR
jgi:hypothetical protein